MNKFKLTFLENIVNYLNKKENEKIVLVNWNRNLFRPLMLQFSKFDCESKVESIEQLFTSGLFLEGESFKNFCKKNDKKLTTFFKNIQDNTFSGGCSQSNDHCDQSNDHLINKNVTKIFVIQEYVNVWKQSVNSKPIHKISICKNPKNIIKNCANKAKKSKYQVQFHRIYLIFQKIRILPLLNKQFVEQ
jgi:hypothetical protein